LENELNDIQKRVNEKMGTLTSTLIIPMLTCISLGIKESDTGLAPPNLWDLSADKQRMSEEQPLQVYPSFQIMKHYASQCCFSGS
jgi:26S proteasome regulatory subunit T1